MIAVRQFEPAFEACLPGTASLLRSAGLVVHPQVSQVTLHGSRGLAGNCRPDSDVDLSLLVAVESPPVIDHELEILLRDVLTVTLSHWRGPVEADLAVVFPLHPCRLACFQRKSYDPSFCTVGGTDCFGIYKVQKGFSGFVLNAGIQVERMYPCVTVWKSLALQG